MTVKDQASAVVQHVIDLMNRVVSKTVTVAVNTVRHDSSSAPAGAASSVTGTAHVSGTAKLNGDWGNKKPGRTLVGELGREIVVDPRTARWYTVGDNGAEFTYIPKNAIVFDHEQSENLLRDGYVSSRAMALAKGTALAGGNAYGGGSDTVSAAENGLLENNQVDLVPVLLMKRLHLLIQVPKRKTQRLRLTIQKLLINLKRSYLTSSIGLNSN